MGAAIYFVPALYEKVYAAIKDGTGRSVEKACGEVISSTQSLAECKAKLGNAAYFALMPDLVIEFGNGVRVTIPSEVLFNTQDGTPRMTSLSSNNNLGQAFLESTYAVFDRGHM